MVRVCDVRRGFLDLSEAKIVDGTTYAEFTKSYRPRAGDIIFSRVGSYGNSCFVDREREVCLGQNTVCISPRSDKIDPFFLYCCLNFNQVRDQIESFVGGASQPTISLKSISKLLIPCPSIGVQRRIASILSAYDDLIENNTRRIAILEEMARALYREWFVHFRFPASAQATAGRPGHEKVKLVDSPLGKIPEGWEVVTIDDVCDCVTDGSHSSPKSVKQGLPMASSKDMHDWGLNIDTSRHIGRDDFNNLVRNGCKPKKNDVLITKDGANYLKRIFVMREELEVVLLSSIAILRPNAKINPHLLAAILKAPENKGRLKNYVTGAAIPRIILKDFKRFQISLPSSHVQLAWARTAQPMTELCWTLIDKNANLRTTRDLLLPKLISGEIDVSALNMAAQEATA